MRRRVGGSGSGKESEGGTVEGFGLLVSLVDHEGEGEVGLRFAFEPSGRHVEEDRALVIGSVEGCEDIGSSWGIEARVAGVVNLYRIVCAVIEQGVIPRHWYMFSFCFQRII